MNRWKTAFWILAVATSALVWASFDRIPNYAQRLAGPKSGAIACNTEEDLAALVMGLVTTQDVLSNTLVSLGFAVEVPSNAPAWTDVLRTQQSDLHRMIKDFQDLAEPNSERLQPWWKILRAQFSVIDGTTTEWQRKMPRNLQQDGPIYLGGTSHTVGTMFMDAGQGMRAAGQSMLDRCWPD